MLKATFRILGISIFLSLPAQAAETSAYRLQETSTYKNINDQNVHSEIVNQLDLSRWGRKLFHKPLRSANANVFDEVPDSTFFTNRHARTALSPDQLSKGYSENEGPDVSGDLTVIGGEINGLQLNYLVKDAHGDTYFLKFDTAENPELATASEIIASRFYYALGYNVPQYTIAVISPGKLKIGEAVKFRDDSGFLKTLTQERLDEYMLFATQTADGDYRVSARKVLAGENKGFFSLTRARKNDPDAVINHRDRRDIRALQVFSAWLNNTDISESNTLDVLVDENAGLPDGQRKTYLKHYLSEFNSALGSANRGAKAPMMGHEYLADFGETTKAFFSLGFLKKPWQKRWHEAGEKSNDSAVGYFDNRKFDPARFKGQLPYEAFKRLTRADGFWAAKQMMAFHDEDIRALVLAGKLTSPGDADYLTKTLIERRDLIVKHWLSAANSLDDFRIEAGKLLFKNLAVQATSESRSYQVAWLNEKGRPVRTITTDKPEIAIDATPATLEIRTSKNAPFVRVKLDADNVLFIHHQD